MKYTIFIIFNLIAFICFSQLPNWQWAKSFGNTAADNASGIATDNLGNSYVCGYYFSPSITIGSTTLTNNGNYDSYIAKFDNSGNPVWAKSFGGNYDDNATAITIDVSGNCYITGYFISPAMVCGTTTLVNSGAGDFFVIKLDVNGNYIWAKNFGDGGANQGNSIACDTGGNVFVTGFYNNPTLTIGTYTLNNSGNDDIFVTKLDASGNVIWAQGFGDNLTDAANGITTDASGNVFVTGFFKSGFLPVGTSTLTNSSPASADIFIVKLANNGVVLNSACAGDFLDEVATGINIDLMGNVILTGYYFSPTLSIGTSTLTSYGSRDIIVIKCNNNLNFLWAGGGGGSSDDYGYGIDSDGFGNIYINGHNHSFLATFGTQTVTTNGGVGDGILIAYNTAGNVIWVDGVGGTSDEGWNALSLDGAGNIYCAGYFSSSSVSVGTTSLTSNGSADLLIAKMLLATDIAEASGFNHDLFVLYPNPTSGQFSLKHTFTNETIRVEVSNSSGELIHTQSHPNAITEFDLRDIPKGIYFIRLYSEENFITKKLIIN